MTDRTQAGGLQVATSLYRFITEEALPAAGIDPAGFWEGVAEIVADLTPVNRDLLRQRDDFQKAIDAWHHANPANPADHAIDAAKYRAFLEEIGYLVPDPGPFEVATENVDPEIATLAGPQLVVPVTNARFALNAANARWGSLYDAFYGTDALPETDGATREGAYNPVRGQRVIETVRAFLDEALPLDGASHGDVTAYAITADGLSAETPAGRVTLKDKNAFAGYDGDPANPDLVLLRHHGLHVEIVIDRTGVIGASDKAGVQDVLVEAALTTIVDFEDSIAAVDAEDKTLAYRNWLGLNTGDLSTPMFKNGMAFTRLLSTNHTYLDAQGTGSPCPAGRCCWCGTSAT